MIGDAFRGQIQTSLPEGEAVIREPLWLSFPIRQEYFDAILWGKKHDEIRARKPFWDTRVKRIAEKLQMPYPSGICFPSESVAAVFIRGGDMATVRFWLRGVELHVNAESALQREPSLQGRKDLGNGEVWKFLIGGMYP